MERQARVDAAGDNRWAELVLFKIPNSSSIIL